MLRNPPPSSSFFTPPNLSASSLLNLIISAAGDIKSGGFKNARRLFRRVKTLVILFDSFLDLNPPPPQSAILCLNELYIIINRAKILLNYCFQSSRLWLIIRNREISGYFHDLEREISTLVDVFPVEEISIAGDVKEHIELLRRQVGSFSMWVDEEDEALWVKILSFLEEFGEERIPDLSDLKETFVDRIGLIDAGEFECEIDFLQNLIFDNEENREIIDGIIAVLRFSRFSLFGTEEVKKSKKMSFLQENSGEISIPKDFCCPISLEVMVDPVIVPTGQTYDRQSITKWIAGGHQTCPNSGQNLGDGTLTPNCAIRSLISHWSASNGIPTKNPSFIPTQTKSTKEANRNTIRILVNLLSSDSNSSKSVAAGELRFLAKTGEENRAMIGSEKNAIFFLNLLLNSPNPNAQENAITAILNLSIHNANKTRIMIEPNCLQSIIHTLRFGQTEQSKENAAATIFSLATVHEYKKVVAFEPKGLEGLVWLLKNGSLRGKRDAVMALFSVAMHWESGRRMVGSGAVGALVGSVVRGDEVAEEAMGVLAVAAREVEVAEMVGREERVVEAVARMMRAGSERGRENAAAALHEVCRRGGAEVADRVAGVPGVERVVRTVAFEGTKRARRKAALLARLLQGREWRVSGSSLSVL